MEAAIIRAELQHDQFHGAASKRPSNPVSQSPELAGGAGFTFEDAVSAEYLITLLGEGYAPGTGDRIVSRVALQQRDFDEPLDDIIVDSRDSKGGRATKPAGQTVPDDQQGENEYRFSGHYSR